MRLLLSFWLLMAVVQFAGCSSLQVDSELEEPAITVVSPSPQQGESPAVSVSARSRELPEVELTAPLMMELLIAEMADVEGQYGIAMIYFFDTAQKSRDPRLAQRATRAAVFAKNYPFAVQAAAFWVELEPQHQEARQALISLLVSLDRYQEAKPHLQQLAEAQRLQQVSKILARAADAKQALALFDDLYLPAERTAAQHYVGAELAFELKQYESALSRLKLMGEEETLTLEQRQLQANALYHSGDIAAAIEVLAELLQRSPDAATIRLRYARMLIDNNQLEQGYQQLKMLSEQLPDNSDVIYGLGLIAYNAGRYDEAKEQFEKLLALNNRVDMVRHTLGQISELQQQLAQAIEWYLQVEKGEYYIQSQLRAAVLMAETGSLQQALAHLQQLQVESEQEQLQLELIQTELLVQAGRYDEAMARYTTLLQQTPDSIELRYARAMVAEKLEQLALLEQDLRHVLQLEPDNHQALNALGYTLADRTERAEEAYQLIERAYQISPDDPAILDSMGWALYRLGRLEEALQFLQQAAEALEDGEIFAHLGEVLWMAGEREAAQQVWQRAKEIDPDNRVLRRTLQRLLP